jgi:hypothetical protein
MIKSKAKLKEEISCSGLFIVLSTRGYLESLRRSDKDIMTQISIARELKKPFIILEDSRMLQSEIEEARKFFSEDNVIDRISVNFGEENSMILVAKKIKELVRILSPESSSINLHCSDDLKR